MEEFNVLFLQEALDDLEEIVLYIAQDSKSAALKMHDMIIDRACSLSTLPERGPLAPHAKMRSAGYRVLLIKPYIAFYRVINQNVIIYRVIHGASNYPMLYERLLQNTYIEE